MHEFVLSGKTAKSELGVKTLDLAKRLLDFGFHPPTVYFPLLVDEALMIEPTETETRETLDAFAEALDEIFAEAEEDPRSPSRRPTRRRCGDSTRSGRRATRSSASRAADPRPRVRRTRGGCRPLRGKAALAPEPSARPSLARSPLPPRPRS